MFRRVGSLWFVYACVVSYMSMAHTNHKLPVLFLVQGTTVREKILGTYFMRYVVQQKQFLSNMEDAEKKAKSQVSTCKTD